MRKATKSGRLAAPVGLDVDIVENQLRPRVSTCPFDSTVPQVGRGAQGNEETSLTRGVRSVVTGNQQLAIDSREVSGRRNADQKITSSQNILLVCRNAPDRN